MKNSQIHVLVNTYLDLETPIVFDYGLYMKRSRRDLILSCMCYDSLFGNSRLEEADISFFQ